MDEKKIFNFAILSIKYYWPIRFLILMKSILLWLVKLNLFVRLPTDLNCTKSKNYIRNSNIRKRVDISNRVNRGNRVNDKVPWIDRLPLTNLNQTKIESYSDYYNICNMVDKKILFTEEI